MSDRPLPRPPLEIELEALPSGTELARVHHRRFAPDEFNSSGRPRARFRPFGDPVVPTLYAARDHDTALAESIFHDVPIRDVRQLPRAALRERLLSRLVAARELHLVALHGRGLQQLGVTRGELTAPAAAHAWTASWGEALHAGAPTADGLVWMARRFTGRPALMLFGDRFGQDDLAVASAPIALWQGAGLELVEAAAQRAGIALLL